MAEKTVKAKQPDKVKQTGAAAQPEKSKPVQKTPARTADRDREKAKQPNRIARWWRETVGELRKVSWPTTQDAWRLTRIVLVVMFIMSAILGILDYVFSWLIALLVS